MTALPSIHALRAIHDALASIHHKKQGGPEKSNRPIYFFAWVWYNELVKQWRCTMGLFDIFKKKSVSVKESETTIPQESKNWDKMWELWENERAESPYQELMTYQAEVNNGGHSQFFLNVDNTGDVDAVVSVLLSVLSGALSRNLEKAYTAYKKYNESNEDKMDDILEKCDDVFYENESDVNEILEKYSQTL